MGAAGGAGCGPPRRPDDGRTGAVPTTLYAGASFKGTTQSNTCNALVPNLAHTYAPGRLGLHSRYSSVLGLAFPKVINQGSVKEPPLDTKGASRSILLQ